ncbi:unnamed protein product [Clonostachys solani]|uniref:Uncharacterized protein n=1 Tax=Clonostachys solani TaxID=160281 RepID=A0A9P0ESN7_9HYPO|nr:unnamed protein product [Clonostachys solani]
MIYLDPMNLTLLLDDFDNKWRDVRPQFKDLLGKRGVFGISAMSVLDILMSLISPLSVIAWMIYRAIKVWRQFPNAWTDQLKSEQEIWTYQWWASGGARDIPDGNILRYWEHYGQITLSVWCRFSYFPYDTNSD